MALNIAKLIVFLIKMDVAFTRARQVGKLLDFVFYYANFVEKYMNFLFSEKGLWDWEVLKCS